MNIHLSHVFVHCDGAAMNVFTSLRARVRTHLEERICKLSSGSGI